MKLLLFIFYFNSFSGGNIPADSTCTDEIDTVLTYANENLGQPYVWAGAKPGGFDCSGFVHYCFKQVGVKIERSSSGLDKTGTPVDIKEARKGDIILFTGTNAKDRSVGHVGIVISEYGEPLKFIHASSSQKHPGVVISEYEHTYYPPRFLGIRRIFDCE
jgi:cell wall-associated NlpC family hydrolase